MKNRISVSGYLITLLAILIIVPAKHYAQTPLTRPPIAPARPVVDNYFGTKITDAYRWMEDMKNPELLDWMKAQGDYTRSMLDKIPNRQAILQRLTELSNASPARVSSIRRLPGEQYLYLKTNSNENIASLYVRQGLKGTEIRLVDPQKMTPANGQPLSIRYYEPSWDGKWIAVCLTPGGAENDTHIRIYNVATGREMGEIIQRVPDAEIAWLPNNRSFFYTRLQSLPLNAPQDEVLQKSRVYQHFIGTPTDQDRVVFGHGVDPAIEINPTLIPKLHTFANSSYVLASAYTGVGGGHSFYIASLTGNTHIRSGSGPSPWRKICDVADEITEVAIHNNDLYLVTYKQTPRYKVIRTSLKKANLATATVVVPPSEAVIAGSYMIGQGALHVAEDALYIQQLNGGLGQIRRIPFNKSQKESYVALPFEGTLAEVQADSRVPGLLFSLTSWVKSPQPFVWNPSTSQASELGLQPKGPYNELTSAEVQEVFVKAADGTPIPLSIIYKKGIKLDGTNPTWLNGYGAYGIPVQPGNSPLLSTWVERGGIYAIAHVRGGGEYGEEWHRAGYQATKPNTWNDFIACAEYLIEHQYTSPRHLGGLGISAGGILIGRAITQRPDLFRAVGLSVGVTDMLRFETTANGVLNIAEFGSVKTEEGFKILYQMSAYHHVKDSTHYPAVLLHTGMNDPRVDPWMMAKMTARLQAATSSGQPVLLRVDYQNGHSSGVTKQQRLETFTDACAFLFWQLGHPEFQPPPPGRRN
jgi:prolyl oligopeptidase